MTVPSPLAFLCEWSEEEVEHAVDLGMVDSATVPPAGVDAAQPTPAEPSGGQSQQHMDGES